VQINLFYLILIYLRQLLLTDQTIDHRGRYPKENLHLGTRRYLAQQFPGMRHFIGTDGFSFSPQGNALRPVTMTANQTASDRFRTAALGNPITNEYQDHTYNEKKNGYNSNILLIEASAFSKGRSLPMI
jgi:hypothetical protein